MFSDWQQALQAEALSLNPNPVEQQAAAARTVARHANGKEDLLLLLDVAGLPTDDDTLTTLLPLLPGTGDLPTMTNTPAPAPSAHEAVALSMYHNGDSEQTILEATGLRENEFRDLMADQNPGLPRTAVDVPAVDVPVIPLFVSTEVQELLTWAAAHPTTAVRSRAARITTDLSELSERRDSEAAQREAEQHVADLKAQLEQAQAKLREVKVGTRTTTAATAPTPIRTSLGSGRTQEELAAVRAWARKNGHQVAATGMVRKDVLKAYDAAHQAPVRKAG
ncbi:histone-like nucleoid-structuring protein Lsr2 [Streptomyces sp. NPDC059255]|uniref:Lsr2 family DNA-binding protein n=1 Tax=Streptomyces sp. NPDC059255 TaxID=3346793 RepID=UPI0036A04036